MKKRKFYVKLLMSMLLMTLTAPLAHADELTVADGTTTSQFAPIYGWYYDQKSKSTMIYSSSMLNEMDGGVINIIKFYTNSNISFSGGEITVKLGEVEATSVSSHFTSGLSQVYKGTPATGTKEYVITLDNPYEYNGGNLAIEVELTTAGSNYPRTYFYVEEQSNNVTYCTYGNYGYDGTYTFLPKTTFVYDAATSEPTIKVNNSSLDFNALTGSTAENTVTVTGRNLTGDITATIAGEGFSVNATTIAAADAANGAELTITYAPTAAGTHTGTLTLSSDGAQDVVVNLNGNAVDPVISGTVTPAELTFETYENVAATGAITIENTGNTAFTPVFSGIEAPFSIAEATEIAAGESKEFTVTYAPEEIGSHTGTLTVTINGAETNVTLTGTATEAPLEATIADGTDTTDKLPVYGYYYDNASSNYHQMIYPASMIPSYLTGKKITSLTFYSSSGLNFSGGNLAVRLATTETEKFETTTKLTIADNAVSQNFVRDASETLDKIVVEFDEPFEYNGGNIIIETQVTTSGTCDTYSNHTFFYGIKTSENYSYCAKGYYGSAELEAFLPKVTFTYEKEEEPAAVEATLAQIEGAEGVVGTKYAITDEYLVAVENRDVDVDGTGYVYVWCKDNDNVTDRLAPAEGVIDFMQQQGVQGDWDQSNWVVLRFKGDDQEARSLKNCKLTNVIGTYVDASNYMIDVESYEKGGSAEYTPNVYCVANFNVANWGTAGVQQEGKDSDAPYYFFMTPKAQEVCEVTFAEWNGSSFQVPTESGFSGALTLGWTYNQNSDGTPMSQETVNLEEGKSYKFNAIVMRSASKGAINGGSVVYPTNLTGGTENDVPTAISTVSVNGMVESVKYYNVAGVESNEPFEGVNIVVTRYSDGSTTTTKVLK